MKNTLTLNQQNLGELSERIPSPTYDRSKVETSIIHIGVGGFHRAHQAFYANALMEKYSILDWGIVGVGLKEADRKMCETLKKQDFLYTLLVKHPGGKMEPQIMGPLTDFLLAVDSPEQVIEQMAASQTKIVSLTITEGGYNFNASTGEFDFGNTDVIHELNHPDEPRTVYGFLTASLRKRLDKGLPAFTIMSCDNIQHNGDVTRNMLLTFARKQDAELASWIEKEVRFPNSMVDRITPVTTEADITNLSETYQINDEWPVTCEPFIQWVIEDNFSNGRPPYEKVSVQFVPDVTPYEKMKIRLLNAGHSVLGILGAIHGHKTINQCMEDKTFASFMRRFMDNEATPILDKVEGINIEQYKDSLEKRFGNPNIKDSVSRICSESSAKLPKFLISTLQENLARDGSIEYATLVIAVWCYYSDKAADKNGQPLEIIDVIHDKLHDVAKKSGTDPLAFVRMESIFGNLAQNERFTTIYSEMVRKIYQDADVKKYMQQIL